MSSPTVSDDFCMVDIDNAEDPAAQTTSVEDQAEHVEIDLFSDDDLEHISGPPSVRSLDTPSPSLTTIHEDASPILFPELASVTTSAAPALHGPLPLRIATNSATQSRVSASNQGQDTELPKTFYTYQARPDDGPPGSGVLVPPASYVAATPVFQSRLNSSTPSPPRANSSQSEHFVHAPLSSRNCSDHATLDHQIMEQLTEHALKSRIQDDMKHNNANDQLLKQAMLTRLMAAPCTHPVMVDIFERAGPDSKRIWFEPDYRDVRQRMCIYMSVFTVVEKYALSLLLNCHRRLFDDNCSFYDFTGDYFFNSSRIDNTCRMRGSQLAIDTQTSCLMSMDFRDLLQFLGPRSNLYHQAHAKIRNQAEKLKDDIDFQCALTQLNPVVTTSVHRETRSDLITPEDVDNVKHSFHNRIAIKDVFSETLTSAHNFCHGCPLLGGIESSPSLPVRSALQRHASYGDSTTTTSNSPPENEASIPGAYPKIRSRGETAPFAVKVEEQMIKHVSLQSSVPDTNSCSSSAPSMPSGLPERGIFGNSDRDDFEIKLLLLKQSSERRRVIFDQVDAATVQASTISDPKDIDLAICANQDPDRQTKFYDPTSFTSSDIFAFPCPVLECKDGAKQGAEFFVHIRDCHPMHAARLECNITEMRKCNGEMQSSDVEQLKSLTSHICWLMESVCRFQMENLPVRIARTDRMANHFYTGMRHFTSEQCLCSVLNRSESANKSAVNCACLRSPSNKPPQEYQYQLMILERQSLERRLQIQREQEKELAEKLKEVRIVSADYAKTRSWRDPSSNHAKVETWQMDYEMQLAILHLQNNKRLAMKK